VKAFVVVDLGFGDAGKGLMTDYLVRRHEAELVVRFNGGAQAGHNVVEGTGRQHTFSQLGSGTFVPGVRTHLAGAVVVHPTALRVEAEHLEALGERNVLRRISIDPACLVTTPFQQAAGRLRELLRSGERHGSCGVGVGETVADALADPELAVRFGELRQPARLRDRLEAQRVRKWAEFSAQAGGGPNADVARELQLLASSDVTERWLTAAADVAQAVRVAGDERVHDAKGSVVFEGAQGVLLDEAFAFTRSPPGATAHLRVHGTCFRASAGLIRWKRSGCCAPTRYDMAPVPCPPKTLCSPPRLRNATTRTVPGKVQCAKVGWIWCCSTTRCVPAAASTRWLSRT